MSKNYIYFFIKNQDLILNLKLKKINQFKYFIESDETIMDKLINLKFSKVTKNVVNENKIKDKLYENFLESFDLILNQKDLNQKIFQNLNTKKIYIKIYGNYKKFYKRYDLQNQISIKKLFQRNTIEKLMNVF
jgi:3-deoxy-D-manno-octulosonic-acid transferase